MERPRGLKQITLAERKGWWAGTWYCDKCFSTSVSGVGTVHHDPKKQEWLESGGDVDNWWCSDCGDETSVAWHPFMQFFLWGDTEVQFTYE